MDQGHPILSIERTQREGTAVRHVIDVAYVAGLFDGEGCVFVTKGPGRRRERSYSVGVQVGNTYEMVIRLLHSLYGGSVAVREVPNHQDYWTWRLYQRQAAEFLEELLPFLRIKKIQAELAIEFWKLLREDRFSRSVRARSPERARLRAWYAGMISAVNKGRLK